MSCLVDKETLDDFREKSIMSCLKNSDQKLLPSCFQQCQEIISDYRSAFPDDCAQLDFLLWLRKLDLISIKNSLAAMHDVIKYMSDHFYEIYKAPKIFISHSEKDNAIVRKFVAMLERMGVKQTQLFCSSVVGYGIPQGAGNIYDYIRNEMSNNNLFVIMMLSENYYNSPMCLNEMGAAWIKKSQYQSILLPGFQFHNIKGAIDPRDISFELTDSQNRNHALNELRSRIIEHLSLESTDYTLWEQIRDDFIQDADGFYSTVQK